MKATVRCVQELKENTVQAMYVLFSRYYADAPFDRFSRDLRSKDRAVLVSDDTGTIVGFSTLAVRQLDAAGRSVRIVYSGDTVVDEPYWGSQALAFAWICEAARIKAEAPEFPLYWLLISKGYRTYRYLDAFGMTFTPDWRGGGDPALDAIKDNVAAEFFGNAYDCTRGIVCWPEPRGRLAPQWAALSERELARQDVRFFVERNPGYIHGDELVCLCALEETNMKPLTRRIFSRGMTRCTVGLS